MIVPNNERIAVRPGDAIGVHYPIETTAGVIPYNRAFPDPLVPCCGVSVESLSRFHNDASRDIRLPLGFVLELNLVTHTIRLPAMKPILGGKMYQYSAYFIKYQI